MYHYHLLYKHNPSYYSYGAMGNTTEIDINTQNTHQERFARPLLLLFIR